MLFLRSVSLSRSLLFSGVVAILALNVLSLFAQEAPLLEWGQQYGGPNWEKAYGGTPTDDGGFVLVGYTESFGAGDADIYLVRVDKFGDTVWTRTYGGAGLDEGYAIEQTAEDKGFIIAGLLTTSVNDDPGDPWIVRTKPNGDTLWTYLWKETDIVYQANTIRETPTGDFVVVGTAQKTGSRNSEAWIAMLDADGQPLWSKTFPAAGESGFTSLDFTNDNGLVVAGFVDKLGTDDLDGWVLRMDFSGDTVWTRTYGGASGDAFSWIRQKSDGAFLCVGTSNSFGDGSPDFLVVELRHSDIQDTVRLQTYGGAGQDYGNSAALTGDGGFVIMGTSNSIEFGSEGLDIVILKADKNNGTQWVTRYGGRLSDEGTGIYVGDDKGYWIVGTTESFTHTGSAADAWILRTRPDLTAGVSEEAITAGGSLLSQPSPNPFDHSTVIGWHLDKASRVTIALQDALGRPVRTLVEDRVSPGTYSTEWNGDDDNGKGLPSGSYFCTMSLDGKLLASKTVVLRR